MVSCTSETPVSSNKDNTQIDTTTIAQSLGDNYGPFIGDPYDISFGVKLIDTTTYELSIAMNLNGQSYFVSPNSTRNFKGKFQFVMASNESYINLGPLVETPETKEEIDPHPFVDGPVNWVRQNTMYKQQIQLKTAKDFEVRGHVQFVIEPRCTLEKIPVILKQENGVLKFEVFGC